MRVYIFRNIYGEKNEAVFMHLKDAQDMLESMKDQKDKYVIETHELVM